MSFRDGPSARGPEPICGRPPARKGGAAATGLVGCGHMSGLCDAVGMTAGPDGLRGSGPKHEGDVQAPTGSPGCPDPRIDRSPSCCRCPCSLQKCHCVECQCVVL